MILRLAWAELRHRPGRAALLLAGYALGVAVMVVLLAVGNAMLEQARSARLVGGGDLVIVPPGVSTEMLRSGGLASLLPGVEQARFLHRQILESPRAREDHGIAAASPLLEGRQVEVTAGERRLTALATGEIPSRAAAAGASPRLLAGRWADSEADRGWVRPTTGALLREIDHFHHPAGAAAADSTWAEWHYFNVVLAPDRWLYLTFLVGGRMDRPGAWGGRILMTVRDAGGRHRSFTRDLPDAVIQLDTAAPDLAFGGDAGVALEEDTYRVRAGAGPVRLDLRIHPAPRRYFPPTALGAGDLVSGYVAPALYAVADGVVCLPACERVSGAAAYHDHNWGVWRGVSWEWGAASDSALSLLYGVVRGESAGPHSLFAYVVDGRGVRGIHRPGLPTVLEWRPVEVAGRVVRVPARFAFRADGLAVEVAVDAAHATPAERSGRGYFVQMRGTAYVREDGHPAARLPGFFETYVD